jgi:DNA polymerase
MLQAVGLDRDRDCYIANIIKCRPPQNRSPESEEIAACEPFLRAQLATIQPKVILALGSFAAQTLLRTKEPIGKLRGRIFPYHSMLLIPTFHPAFLLRNPGQEYRRQAWEDLKLARREYDRLRSR